MLASFPAEYFSIQTMTAPIDLSNDAILPRELRHAFRLHPHHREHIQRLIEAGGVFEVHTLQRVPETLLHAVDQISRSTQEQTLLPWLSRLVRDHEVPTFTTSELHAAEREGIDLYQAARLLVAHRDIGKRFVCHAAIEEDKKNCLQELNAALLNHSMDEFLYRLHQDYKAPSKKTRAVFLQSIIGIGPLAHVFERWLPGMGKVFAALASRLWEEGREVGALHASGSTFRQLIKRSSPFFLAAVFAVGGMMLSQTYLSRGRVSVAGALFGISSMLLPLVMALTALQKKYRALLVLKSTGKLRAYERSLWSLAFREHMQQPPYVSAYIGIWVVPILSVLAFRYLPNGSQNGWILALLSVADTGINELLTGFQDFHRRGVWTDFRRRFDQKHHALDAAYKMR